MKRIIVHVFPEGEGGGAPVPAASRPPDQQNGEKRRAGAAPNRELLKVEVLLSDAQAQRVLSMLVEHEPHGAEEVMIEEMLQRQLDLAGPDAENLFDRIVLSVERQLITQVFEACEKVKTKAAARLGIDRNTLHKKLRKYELIQEDADVSS